MSSILNPWWLVGFTEGEGSFYVSFRTKRRALIVEVGFGISQADKVILDRIKDFFGYGRLHRQRHSPIAWMFRTESIRDAKEIRNFFNKYPLHGKKGRDFELWSNILDLVDTKQHLTKDGMLKILSLRNQMNLNRKGKRISDEVLLRLIERREKDRHQRCWLPSEDKYLKENYTKLGKEIVGHYLGRTASAIRMRWRRVKNG